MRTVLHLVGSAVSDFHADLSRLYAADCLDAVADPDRYDHRVAWVSPDGTWRFPADLSRAALAEADPVPAGDAIAAVAGMGVDVAVPQMFCVPGMTAYRGLLDVLRIPFLGNAPDVMAVAANKARARAVVAADGVAVPHGELLRPGDTPSLAAPYVVKPVDTDNSLGLALVRDPADGPAALATAFTHSHEVLVESYVELGREVRCGIVERPVEHGTELVGLPLEEYDVDTDRKPVRLHDDKIAAAADGELSLAAKDGVRAWMVDVADPVTETVWAAARACHRALGCRDYSLFDFRIDPAGRPWFLEASLYNSFARQSVVTMMAEAGGIALPDLFASTIDAALARG